MEAKCVACSLATQEAMWLRSFVHDLNLTPRVDDPVEMLCDNTTAIQFAKDPKFHQKTKYVNRRYHFVQDAIKIKEVSIKYIPTNKMIANPLTKLIPRDAFQVHSLSLGLCRI